MIVRRARRIVALVLAVALLVAVVVLLQREGQAPDPHRPHQPGAAAVVSVITRLC